MHSENPKLMYVSYGKLRDTNNGLILRGFRYLSRT